MDPEWTNEILRFPPYSADLVATSARTESVIGRIEPSGERGDAEGVPTLIASADLRGIMFLRLMVVLEVLGRALLQLVRLIIDYIGIY